MQIKLALAILALNCPTVNPDRFLACIQAVEGNEPGVRNEKGGGVYGFTEDAWKEDSDDGLDYAYAWHKLFAAQVAKVRLARFSVTFKKFMVSPSVFTLASAWRFGLKATIHREYPSDELSYGARVNNLYLDKTFHPELPLRVPQNEILPHTDS